MPYNLGTEHFGVVAEHADRCPAGDGFDCRCGPLGFRARIWDWESGRPLESPLFRSIAAAGDWQRAANGSADADEADPAEKVFWWAFCYVGLLFVGVAVALFASDIAG
jgi:hypothetical protein